jgi:hypothetical protein
VAVAPAVVRRDGRAQAAGHPADHARLGLAEERLHVAGGTRPAPAGAAAGQGAGRDRRRAPGHDWRAVLAGALELCSIDGSLIRVSDSDANRQAYGSAGRADGSSPELRFSIRLTIR